MHKYCFSTCLPLLLILTARIAASSETYHILRIFTDGECTQTHFATRFLPNRCASYMGSFYKREANATHMWASLCEDNQCNDCLEPLSYAQIDRCSQGMIRSAGEASQLFIPSPIESNILIYYRNTASCSPTQDQIEEVRATPDSPFCHVQTGLNNRFSFRCSASGRLQLVNCTEPQYGSCGNPSTCTTTDYPESLTSLCLNDVEFDLTLTYSCNFSHFLAGSITPPESNVVLNINTGPSPTTSGSPSAAAPTANASPLGSSAPSSTGIPPSSPPASQGPVSTSPKAVATPSRAPSSAGTIALDKALILLGAMLLVEFSFLLL